MSAVLTAVLAALFIAIGIVTPVRPVDYPYVNGLAAFVPGDYLWMYPGFLLAPAFVALMTSVYAYAPEQRKVLVLLGLAFAIIYATLVSVDYFIQFTVIAPSIVKGETASLSLFTEYNPHGIFIAVESLGYLMMAVAFLFAALAFDRGRIQYALRGLFTGGFVLAVGFLIGLSLLGYDIVTFEVAIITIDSSVLVSTGILLSFLFRRAGSLA